MEIIEQIGAYAGLASIVGLAILSALYFSQARDVKRLREWAGRAPERAAEQAAPQPPVPGRVVAEPRPKPAAPQQAAPGTGAPSPAPAAPAATGARPAAATSAAQGRQPAPAGGNAGGAAAPAPAAASSPAPAGAISAAKTPAPAAAGTAAAAEAPAPAGGGNAGSATAVPDAGESAPPRPPGPGHPATQGGNAAGAEAAGAAATESKAPPAAPPTEPGADKPEAAGVDAARPAAPVTPAAARAPAAPPVPGGPARPAGPARPVGRAASPPPKRPSQDTVALPPPREPWYRRLAGRSRYVALAVAGVLIVGGGAAFGIAQLINGDEGGSAERTPEGAGGGGAANEDVADRRSRRPAAVNPANVTVAVLNGTTVPGLAASIGDRVEQFGFQLGTVANSPDQTRQRAESVVMYSPGAKRAAAAVGRRLRIPQREPIDPESQGLAGDSTVVVIAGRDRTQ